MKWTRAGLKGAAKQVLRKHYWHAFIVALVVGLFAAGGSGVSSKISNPQNVFGNRGNNISMDFGDLQREIRDLQREVRDLRIDNFSFEDDGYSITFSETQTKSIHKRAFSFFTPAIFGILGLFTAGFALIFIVLRILVGSNLKVGGARYFVSAAEDDDRIGYLGFGFKSGRYFSIMIAMFMKSLFTFLWGLLFVIPGIVKSYSYSMLPYILADNPSLGYSRALDISKQITRGHKFDMFVLDLSFIGWYILGGLAFGIGTLFVTPYEMATQAQLYITLRQNGIDNGITSYDELNLSVVTDLSDDYIGQN